MNVIGSNERDPGREEWMVINEFKLRYEDFPEGILTKSESPDFILYGDRKIGIEITRIFHDSFGKPSAIKERSEFKSNTTNLVISHLCKMLPWTFYMNIDYRYIKFFRKAELNKRTEEIATYCFGEFENLDDRERRELMNTELDLCGEENLAIKPHLLSEGFRNLPPGVDSIAITRWDGLPFSWNSQVEGGSVPHLTMQHIQPSLQEKERKLKHFQFCNEQWLLITSGDYYYGTFNQVIVPRPLQSTFDKVFFFRVDTSQIFLLT